MSEFIAYAKTRPGELNYASSGWAHCNSSLSSPPSCKVGIKLTHVPDKGVGQSFPDLFSGPHAAHDVERASMSNLIRSKGVRAIAVTTREAHCTMLPEVPTMIESGVPGIRRDAVARRSHGPAERPQRS